MFAGPIADAVRRYAPPATSGPDAEPNPYYLRGPAADQPPDPMPLHDKMRLRAAAYRATRIYPDPVGQLISDELLSWEQFGFHIGPGLVMQLVDHCMKTEPAAPTR